jgi:hypothetical protein
MNSRVAAPPPLPETINVAVADAVREEIGGRAKLHAMLSTAAKGFAHRLDTSFLQAEIRVDAVRNLRSEGVSVLLRHEVLAHPGRHPRFLSPPSE